MCQMEIYELWTRPDPGPGRLVHSAYLAIQDDSAPPASLSKMTLHRLLRGHVVHESTALRVCDAINSAQSNFLSTKLNIRQLEGTGR